MEILVYIIAYAVAIAVGTLILAGSLFLVEDVNASSFKELGALNTLARAAAIVLVTGLLSLIPFGVLLALPAWFLGIMFLFQKSFVQTLILLVVNALFSYGVTRLLEFVLTKVLGD